MKGSNLPVAISFPNISCEGESLGFSSCVQVESVRQKKKSFDPRENPTFACAKRVNRENTMQRVANQSPL